MMEDMTGRDNVRRIGHARCKTGGIVSWLRCGEVR
jgi:hypothetical protein